MAPSQPVEHVYPVLRQWAFIAFESVAALDVAIEKFLRARTELNQGRHNVASDVWRQGNLPEDRDYEASIFRMQGASYFLISAARQVVRILDVDPTVGRLPNDLHNQVHQMRNVIEHWDEWTNDQTKRGARTSAARLRDVDPEVWPFGFKFNTDMDFLVGGTISLSELRTVLTALWDWQASLSSTHDTSNAQADPPCPLVPVPSL